MRVHKFYDIVAPIYRRIVPTLLERVTVRAVHRLGEGAPATVLEVGVGPGQALAALAEKRPARIVGVDVSRAMLRQARRSLANGGASAALVRADARHLPFLSASFEGVIAAFVVEVMPQDDIPAVLTEMSRVLVPGGRIVIATVHVSSPLLRSLWMLAYRTLPDVVGHLRPLELGGLLEERGLRLLKEEEIPVGAGARLLSFVKVVG